ncbi:mannitol dehydrogenase family protein [Microbacterium sp. C23T]
MTSITEAATRELPYDRSDVRAGIAHFGVGNFHRVHQALYIDRILRQGEDLSWGIVGIGLSDGEAARDKAEKFHAQNGLYSLTEYAPDGSSRSQIVGSMIDYLHAPSDPERVLSVLTDPNLRIVTLTITEGGYLLNETTGVFQVDHPAVQAGLAADAPTTVFGFLVEALRRRRKADTVPFTVVSCDNLRQNGSTTRRAVVGYAAAVDAELADWIDANVSFPNSMVDRIAPYVTDEDRVRLNAETGIDDLLPVMSESYLQWVIEDEFPAGRPALESVGVQLRPDVHAFEAVKGRMLNASHVLLSYPGLLLGYRYVDEAMRDERLRELLDVFMETDVIPLLTAPEGVSLQEYKQLILDRFANPAVGDQLIRIATDGAAKIPVFHTATIRELIEKRADIRREAFLFACYTQYLAGSDDNGGAIEVTEPSLTRTEWDAFAGENPFNVLRFPTFRPLVLTSAYAFTDEYLAMRARMNESVASALEVAVRTRVDV